MRRVKEWRKKQLVLLQSLPDNISLTCHSVRLDPTTVDRTTGSDFRNSKWVPPLTTPDGNDPNNDC